MYVGVDLGGTKIAAAIVNEQGEILKRVHIPTNAKAGEEAVINNVIKACDTLLEDADEPPRSIGIGVPGSVNSKTGRVIFTANLPLRNADIASYLKNKYNCEVYLGNDANCAVLGEAIAGSAKGSKNVAMITLGTGLGGGLIVNGTLVTGLCGSAGEVGHIVINIGGRECGCGRKGCWETYASAKGLVATALDLMDKNPESLMWELCVGMTDRVDGRVVFEAYRAKDATAIAVVDKYIGHLAIGIVNLINMLEPEVFCIGGGVSNAWDCMEKPLIAAVENEKFSRFSTDMPKTKIVKATLGNEAGIIGAAMLGENVL